MKRLGLFLITFILLFPYVLKAEEISLTLDEAVAIALRDNRDIILKTEDVKKAKLKIAEAQGSLFPSLSFTGSWTKTRGYYNKDIAQTATQTSIKQNLYKGGKIINTIKYNGYKFEVAQAILDKTKLEVVLSVKKALYTLLLAQELAKLNEAVLENTKEHLDFIRERYKKGQASESDILNMEASLRNVEQVYEASLNQVEESLALLNNLLFLDEDTRIKPQTQFHYEPMEAAYDEAFLKAMVKRPEIRQYEAQLKADKKSIEIAKSDSRPNIYASWDYYSRSHMSGLTGLSKNWNDYNTIGLTFSWPIFDGWATKAKVEQAIVDLKETQLLKEKTLKDISLELKNAYLALKNAIVKLEASESEVRVYSDNYSSVKQKYEQGIASLLDMSDANLQYQVSIFNKNEAVYDYIIAKSDFDKATGGL